MSWGERAWMIVLLSILVLLVAMGCCTSREVVELELRHKAIQDCILSGGHAHPGPGNTIWCD